MSQKQFITILIVALVMSVVTFIAFAIDRSRARHRRSRIPDLVLILLALCGGSPGAILAMGLLRVKNHNPQYLIGMPLIFAVETLVVLLGLPW